MRGTHYTRGRAYIRVRSEDYLTAFPYSQQQHSNLAGGSSRRGKYYFHFALDYQL
ncbi:UNVERIFIED_CONTAM: hypothetical protein FKN15_041581 [Acipenser sinensis]